METIRRFDQKISSTLQKQLPASSRPLMAGFSLLGEPIIILSFAFIGLVTAYFSHHEQTERAFFVGGIAYGINILLKFALHRARPHNLKISTFGIKSYSFPSGHAFGTVIFYGLYAYLDYISLAKPWDWLIALAISCLIVLIGLSRVVLKTHYPSDVVAGWLLGVISLFIVIRLTIQ